MTITTTDLQYSLNIQNKPDVAIELDMEYNSASTTSTNSPVFSEHQLELPCCPCNQLITSQLECSDCQHGFIEIQKIQQENKATKETLEHTRQEYNSFHSQRIELDNQHVELQTNFTTSQDKITSTLSSIESMHYDIQALRIKCKEEASQVGVIQQAKLNVEMELSELTERLKQEADSLVAIEQREQKVLKKKNHQLEKEISLAHSQLEEASSQLKLIRDTMEQQRDTGDASPIEQQQPIENTMIDTYTRAQVETILMHGLDLGLFMDTLEDDAALMDFNDFIQLLYKTPLRKLSTLKYMKYCIKEDVEPCLRFGPNPKIASKKIMDAIMVKSCFIEECPDNFVTEQATRLKQEAATATMWERFTTSNVFLGCQACGRTSENIEKSRQDMLAYRFRISYFDEWACIDRYCRDRLLAVTEFYMFIRHLRAGAYKHRSLHELYQQFTRLKLQMFIARMGALPNLLQNCGINIQKVASAFHGEDINSSIMLLPDERLSSSTESTITISTVESPRTSASSCS